MKGHILKSLTLVLFISCFVILGCKAKQVESPFKSDLPQDNQTITITSEEVTLDTGVTESVEQTLGTEVSEPAIAEPASIEMAAPSPIEIQTALRNAGYYQGSIDGKLGPKSKEAVMEFQKNSNLKADGKVGPKTWSKLKAFSETSKQ